MEWEESFSVGNDFIDVEHKLIIEYINRISVLNENWKNQKSVEKQEVEGVIDNLIEYTKEHFAHEEKILAQHSYSGLEAHKKIHARLITSVGNLKEKLDEMGVKILPFLEEFLSTWLKEHIMKVDKRYSNFIGKRATPQ